MMLKKLFNFVFATILDFLATLRCLFYTLFVPSTVDVPIGDLADKPEIICVHGYLHNDTPWGPLRKYLQKQGGGPLNALRYFSVREDIPAGSKKLKEKIASMGRPVDILIGHSQGGLICLEYALEHASKDRITTVIALASPIHGTLMAKIGFGPSSRQMEINSPYLKSLHARLKEAKHLRLLALASEVDWMVPANSAIAEEYPFATNVVFNDIGHVNFLFSKKIMNEISSFLFIKNK